MLTSSDTLWPTDEVRGFAMWQPWAAFVAYGIKWIETRSWSTPYRGRVKILAAKRPPFSLRKDGGGDIIGDYVLDWGLHGDLGGFTNGGFDEGCGFVLVGPDRDEDYLPMHLGCFIAEVDLVDCVPMLDRWKRIGGPNMPESPEHEIQRCVTIEQDHLLLVTPGETPVWRDVSDQRPYGDFQPRRFAWIFDNVKLIDPEPAKGHQGLWRVVSPSAEQPQTTGMSADSLGPLRGGSGGAQP